MRLKEKVTLITGGSRGIGRAISERFAQEGARVIINYLPDADSSSVAGSPSAQEVERSIIDLGGEASCYPADVSDSTAVVKMINDIINSYGRLDVLICNAGICPFSRFTDITEEQWDRVHDVNLKGAFLCSQAAAKVMMIQKSGRILFTSSVSSIFGGSLQAHYCPTKGGINQLMKSVALAVGEYGITSNAVLPGTVVTDINYQQLEIESPDLKQYFIDRTPLRRLAEPKDIASAMVFFASEEAAMISGATLIVDGGMSVNLQ